MTSHPENHIHTIREKDGILCNFLQEKIGVVKLLFSTEHDISIRDLKQETWHKTKLENMDKKKIGQTNA